MLSPIHILCYCPERVKLMQHIRTKKEKLYILWEDRMIWYKFRHICPLRATNEKKKKLFDNKSTTCWVELSFTAVQFRHVEVSFLDSCVRFWIDKSCRRSLQQDLEAEMQYLTAESATHESTKRELWLIYLSIFSDHSRVCRASVGPLLDLRKSVTVRWKSNSFSSEPIKLSVSGLFVRAL